MRLIGLDLYRIRREIIKVEMVSLRAKADAIGHYIGHSIDFVIVESQISALEKELKLVEEQIVEYFEDHKR